MKIAVITVGKLKESYLKEAVSEYLKRLSRYADVNVMEVDDERTDENAGENEIRNVLRKEGERILGRIRENDRVIALAIEGETFDSVGLSAKLKSYQDRSVSRLVFVIGGSLGLSEEVYRRSDERWSFSKLTFPHQLMRVILLEQIYRGFRILKNEPYHK